MISQRILWDAQHCEFGMPTKLACDREEQFVGSRKAANHIENVQAVVPAVADVEQRERPGLKDAMRKGFSGLERKQFEDLRPQRSRKVWLRDSSSFSFPLEHTSLLVHLFQE